MFGISWAEFFVIIVIAVLVIPSRMWPDVARFLAKIVKVIRKFVWKITDVSENIKQQIELEKPIDDLIKTATVLPSKKKSIKTKKKKGTK